ncbi:MAG: SRPBCC family protein [Marmoricola sp.]
MPDFALTMHTDGTVEEVWKLLHDPSRFPEWWEGIETVRTGPGSQYTMWPRGYPDFPMDQRLEASPAPGTVTISCLVSDLVFRWQLRESTGGTDVDVQVELPERESHRLPEQRRLLEVSLVTLSRLASGV